MINSRKIEDLSPKLQAKALRHVSECKKQGIDLLIYCTYRDFEAQNALYAQGRTTAGGIVTMAKGGESWHNYRAAYDCVPLRQGKPVWNQVTTQDKELWLKVGTLGEACGLEWAGRWTGELKETAHFQDSQGLTFAQARAGGIK